MKNVDISVIVFAGDDVEGALPVNHVSDEFVLDPGEVVLTLVVDHVVLDSIWKDDFVEVFSYLYYDLNALLNVSYWLHV